MHKLSIVGLIFSGTYVGLVLLIIGFLAVYGGASPHNSALYANLTAILPAFEIMKLVGLGGPFMTWFLSASAASYYFVVFLNAVGLYLFGWIVGMIGSGIKRGITKHLSSDRSHSR